MSLDWFQLVLIYIFANSASKIIQKQALRIKMLILRPLVHFSYLLWGSQHSTPLGGEA
ncbi:hypothetical protein [Desulfosporosinus lacus]|uniref:Uncharacterized protein n=1 Tax=Desulfosporosinus lacus DSM 15449 TaxID=1121420 RepID=A0A1M5VCS4_9FIRM|nr:hypothetical protein [Desulfosporosinus lacus]SHH72981.1 hypothetical protein SAMN02746098_01298 [Desulfosporosinus lacus DSM 15449]